MAKNIQVEKSLLDFKLELEPVDFHDDIELNVLFGEWEAKENFAGSINYEIPTEIEANICEARNKFIAYYEEFTGDSQYLDWMNMPSNDQFIQAA